MHVLYFILLDILCKYRNDAPSSLDKEAPRQITPKLSPHCEHKHNFFFSIHTDPLLLRAL